MQPHPSIMSPAARTVVTVTKAIAEIATAMSVAEMIVEIEIEVVTAIGGVRRVENVDEVGGTWMAMYP